MSDRQSVRVVGSPRRSWLGRTLLASLVVVLTLSVAPGAWAQRAPYPPGRAVACERTEGTPGHRHACQAGGFRAGSPVHIEVAGMGWTVSQEVLADSNGVATAVFQIPPDAREGPFRVTFTGLAPDGSTRSVSAFGRVVIPGGGAGRPPTGGTPPVGVPPAGGGTVVGAPDPGAAAPGAPSGPLGGTLVRTGLELTRGAAIGIGLVLLGALAVVRARRRSNVVPVD